MEYKTSVFFSALSMYSFFFVSGTEEDYYEDMEWFPRLMIVAP